MNFLTLLLLILIINLSKEKEEKEEEKEEEKNETIKDFPPNYYFDLHLSNQNKTILYNGSQLAYLEIDKYYNCSNMTNITFDFNKKIISFNYLVNNSYNSFITENLSNNSSISYGEIIFIKYEKFSYCISFFGFFITFYGPSHYIFGIIIHISLFLYFLIKDFVELFGNFNEVIPLFLITASFISGIVFVTFNYFSECEQKLKNKIIKTLYGGIFGFFLFKTIFYNIVIFTPLNVVVYFIFLFIFLILGFCFGLFINYIYNLDKYFYIPCSILPGSFYIVKGIGFIVGGYYSDIITIKKRLNFKGNCKNKVLLYMFIQIIIIICSILYQIFYNNYIYIESSDSTTCSTKTTSRSSLLTNDISKVRTKEVDETKIENNNTTFVNNSGNENDESNDIYDQED